MLKKIITNGCSFFYKGWFVSVFTGVAVSIIFSACKKQVEISTPYTALNIDAVYSTDASAISVLTGLYADLSSGGTIATGNKSISFRCGLSADEFYGTATSLGSTYSKFYQNALSNVGGLTFWEDCYKYLYTINVALTGVSNSTSLTPSVQKQLIGEARFMRAFLYYYLVSLYGDVPLILTTNYQNNATLSRTPQAVVIQQIKSDLQTAKLYLSSQYLDASLLTNTMERVRPTTWAASSLLSRVYLANNEYANAESEASLVIGNNSLYDTVSLNNVFLKNSKESIWQLQPVRANQNTPDGILFNLQGQLSTANPVALSDTLLKSFEANDKRKDKWVNSIIVGSTTYYYPYKYKATTGTVSEYTMVLRLAEQYLIRAEARARLGTSLSGAAADLNVIRSRAGLPAIGGLTTSASLLSAILHERQIELFSEWGHRWFDLKRTGNISSVMSIITPKKGGTWNDNWQYYPLPITDLNANISLSQNPGY